MAQTGIKLVGDIYTMELAKLEEHFGRYGHRLYEPASGIDRSPVVSNRVRKQISAEDTFPEDIPLSPCVDHVRRLAEKIWIVSKNNARQARTVVLKLKTKEFSSFTRSLTPGMPITSCETLVDFALSLLQKVDLDPKQLYRLVGVG
jgi:DNA polymerase IV